jgi:hypothetical protein
MDDFTEREVLRWALKNKIIHTHMFFLFYFIGIFFLPKGTF